ncbi:GxGYxYP domain-containing protein [Streptomyces spongiae]|uniref:GxGYxYP putative glycoside hydrolase C-terminal domain-containing protein n=1 Tax=Streptomyces spongiae TaxID=565072 RepID=A0A5N8XLS4_9ACTN|nr:GxGYxYP domain-containing protein [Streptomyces spongiae]MPY60036.1 hypothetical protein [Streptomyces spongiae]
MISRRTFGLTALAATAPLAVPGSATAAAPGAGGAVAASAVSAARGIALPKATPLRRLDVIPSGTFTSDADRVLVAALQGLVAKTSSEQIFIDEGGPGAVWKDFLHTEYGVVLDDSRPTWPALLKRFRQHLAGYVLYDMAGNPPSVNVASSLSGPMKALPVDVSQEAQVRALGVTRQVLDVTGRTEKWAYDRYGRLFSRTTAAELNPSVRYHLRDYIAMTDAFTFYDGVTDWRAQVLGAMKPGAALMGYGNNEYDMVEQASQRGVTSIPSDLAPNLSALSAVYGNEGLTQKPQPTPKTRNKHYVSFVISDGDNVAWNLWGLQQYFSNPDRGRFDVGYGIAPSLVDLAPAAMRWYYENASRGAASDCFIAGPSGSGYVFPAKMPPDDLALFTNRLNAYMAAGDLGISEILDDQDSFFRNDVWSAYLRQPNIDALFFFGYGDTDRISGRISWVNGKPVIAQRDVLWAGLTEEGDLIRNINSRPAAPTSADGYTLVLVHCWTKSLSDIRTVVDGLGPDVEVVTPKAFTELIVRNRAR